MAHDNASPTSRRLGRQWRLLGAKLLAATIVLLVTMPNYPDTALAADRPDRPGRPSVLIIMCDQLSARVLGCYGGVVPTPHIDRLAREGVRFDGAVCTTPFCSPSRASIITGMYPHAHGIVCNVNRRDYPAIRSPTTEEGIKGSDATTESLLHAAGYLYHLADDPGETRNLAGVAGYQSRKREMMDALRAWLRRTGWQGREP